MTDPDVELKPVPLTVGKLQRYIYISLGCFFVGLGYVGAVMPVLPTTPFLLLASYFFARSSPRLHRWLRRTPYFGHLIHDWEEHRGIRPRVKAMAVSMVLVVVGSTILFSNAPDWAKW
ncbi:hypothetical protein BH11PLA2_BH11PLA2_39330 [soil metagenome]